MKIDYHVFKSMVNRYLSRHAGRGRPTFYDIRSTYPELEAITRGFPQIRAEFEAVHSGRANLPRYQDVDPGEAKITNKNPEKAWKVFMLYILGHKPEENRTLCPETCRILDGIPGLIQAFFSILDPGKSIPQHEGPYLGYLRFHLGLRVPKDNPPRLIVNGQEYVWKEGEGVLFDDSYPHSVENSSRETRAVLVVDVLRRLPLMPSLVNRFITNVVARHTYGRAVARRVQNPF